MFVGKMEELARSQEAKPQEAVIGIGDLKLSANAKRFEISQTTWFSMPEERRRAHLKSFPNHFSLLQKKTPGTTLQKLQLYLMRRILYSVLTITLSSSSVQKLSIGPDDTGIQQMPQEIIGGIWEKAESLLNDPTSITFAPGTNSN